MGYSPAEDDCKLCYKKQIGFMVCWGLNFQIEHHLFPKISHIHYPQISKIIKQACQEYGVQYVEYRKMSQAVVSHIAYLRHMAKVS